MKPIHLLLVGTFCATVMTTACSQNAGKPIVIGTIDSIQSKVLNEKRAIWVSVPRTDSISNSLYGAQHYPVVYLLDGSAHLYSVMGMIHQLSTINGNMICPEMIVVGIPNTNRTRDLTPSHVSSRGGDSAFVRTSGGGEQFTSFLEKELIPYIDSSYPTTPYRMLIGHSFGGLMVMNTLIHHSGLFNSYVAIDPSLGWDDQKLLKQMPNALQQNELHYRTLFIAAANTMAPGMDTLHVKRDTSEATLHIRSIFECVNALNRASATGLRWNWKYYGEEDHGSVPLIAEYDALHFIFKDYRLQMATLFDSTVNAEKVVIDHFKKVSEQMGYDVLPPEPMVNSLGYTFLGSGKFPKALSFFEMNVRNYPKSLNALDSMGDYYAAKGDKEKAIDCYTKALSRNNWSDTRKKLEDLQSVK
jgi:predicted alpha/beta superfamily hydrolase